jgi:hypothetical protein
MTERTITIIRGGEHCSPECPWLYGHTCLLFRDEEGNDETRAPQHLFKNGDRHYACADCDLAMENLALFDKMVLP